MSQQAVVLDDSLEQLLVDRIQVLDNRTLILDDK